MRLLGSVSLLALALGACSLAPHYVRPTAPVPPAWPTGAAYPVEKLFRAHYAEQRLAYATGTFRDLPKRKQFFDEIATMRPEDWRPGAVDALATRSADGRRIVIKAVNYEGRANTLLVRLDGSRVPAQAACTVHTITAGLTAKASLEHPDAIAPVSRTLTYSRELTIDLEPYTVAVIEILST